MNTVPEFYDNISEDLLELVEQMAEHVHDKWIEEKMRQGWKYGDTRDDEKKTSPCMVSYRELTEMQKNYDRVTSIETINFLVSNGYEIVKRN